MKKMEAVDYAAQMGWTKVDAKRAFESLQFPAEDEHILRALVQFAGPELKERQYKQAAQKAQVTVNKNLVEALEKQYEEMVIDYEQQLHNDRSAFITIIKVIYGVANKIGFKDPWIEGLLATYDQYIDNSQNFANSSYQRNSNDSNSSDIPGQPPSQNNEGQEGKAA